MDLNRRRLLRASGVAGIGGLTAIAGCSDSEDAGESSESDSDNGTESDDDTGSDGQDSTDPSESDGPYTDWIQPTESGDVSYILFDVRDEGEDDSDDSEELTDAEKQDPMISIPFNSVFAAFALSKYSGYGLESLVNNGDAMDSLGSTLDIALILQKTMVAEGDLQADQIEEAIRNSKNGGALEASEEIGSFTVFTSSDESVDPIAVNDSAIILPSDQTSNPVDALRATIETYTGQRERAEDVVDELPWLVDAAGTGVVTVGTFGDAAVRNYTSGEDGFDALAGMDGFICSWDFDVEASQTESTFAGIVGEADKAALESSLGSSADDVTVEFDSGRVTATATWQE